MHHTLVYVNILIRWQNSQKMRRNHIRPIRDVYSIYYSKELDDN